jgi:hypothetical protein
MGLSPCLPLMFCFKDQLGCCNVKDYGGNQFSRLTAMPPQSSLRRFIGNKGVAPRRAPLSPLRVEVVVRSTDVYSPEGGWSGSSHRIWLDDGGASTHESGVVGVDTHSSVVKELRTLVFSCNCGSQATTAKLLAASVFSVGVGAHSY